MNRSLTTQEEQLSHQLYFVLVMLLRGRALDVAYNIGSGEGLETYRKLYETFHPRVASRFVGSLSLILNTIFSGSDLEAELETFDKTVRRYENESGKRLDDELLLGIVVNGLQDNGTRDHVIRNATRLRTYQDVRTELLEISRTNRVISQLPTPMDIGAVPLTKGGKKGKGKDKSSGKGQGGKTGKGKDQKDSKGKGSSSSNPNANKECHYCHKLGHLKADCRKKQADDKARNQKGGSGKGSGKPRTQAAAPEAAEPEPMTAVPQGIYDGECSLIASLVARQDILVDTRAGSNLFVKNFHPCAVDCNTMDRKTLTTVTGEPLEVGPKKRSFIETSAGRFAVEYCILKVNVLDSM